MITKEELKKNIHNVQAQIHSLLYKKNELEHLLKVEEEKDSQNFLLEYNITEGSNILLIAKNHDEHVKLYNVLSVDDRRKLLRTREVDYCYYDSECSCIIEHCPLTVQTIESLCTKFDVYIIDDTEAVRIHDMLSKLQLDTINSREIIESITYTRKIS